MNKRYQSDAIYWKSKKKRRDEFARNNNEYKRLISRKRRQTAQKYAKIYIAISDSHFSKRKEVDKKDVAVWFLTTSLYFDSLKDNFVQRLYSSSCELFGKNKKNVPIFQSTQASIRQESRWQKQRRRWIEHKQRKRNNNYELTMLSRLSKRQTRVFKEVELLFNRLWKLFYCNKTRRILQIESKPNKSKLI